MKTLKVPPREAEKAKQYLLKNNLYDKEHLLLREKEHLYFPLVKLFRLPPFLNGEITEKNLKTTAPQTLSGSLEKELKQLLIEKHNFSAERTEKKIKDFLVKQEEKTQSGLNKWF